MSNIIIYDSGVGGQVVYEFLRDRLAEELEHQTHCLDFFADHANFPYGRKSESQLKEIVAENLHHFTDQGYEVIGIACNTASIIIEKFQLHVHASAKIFTIIEPTARAVLSLGLSSVHVIGSQFAIASHAYRDRLLRDQPDWQVTEAAEQDLIEAIERDDLPLVSSKIERLIAKLPTDTQVLVLACTHFSKVIDVFERAIQDARKELRVVDSSQVLVEEIHQSV